MIEIENPEKSYSEYPGPILLLAGPGTGKTYQIEKRIVYLVKELGASPDEISVITFTAAAARNMRKRLAREDHELPPDKRPRTITTMHSLGNSIIGKDPTLVGLPREYGVLSEPEYREVLVQDGATLARVDRASWKLMDECRRRGACNKDMQEEKCQICAQYEGILRKCGLVDYDDQIMLACQLLQSNLQSAVEVRKHTKYLLVDEYQDINEAQCQFIKLLVKGQTEGLFVVGDDDQSIYSFRGGDPKYICNFEEYYGDTAKIGKLSKSWRCPEHILLGARSVVEEYYPERAQKPDVTFSEEIISTNKIVLYDMPSETAEAQQVASIAECAVKDMRTTIVIIPNRYYLAPLRDALARKGLSFNYKMEPNKDGLIRFSVLANWVDKREDSALLRYLLDLVVANNDAGVKQLPLESTKITERRIEALRLIAELWKDVTPTKSLYKVLSDRSADPNTYPFERKIKETCLDPIEDALAGKNKNSRKGLPEFLRLSGLMVAPGKNPQQFLAEIEDWKHDKRAAGEGSYLPVDIYNMRTSKGLEAQVICVIGLSEGVFPRDDDDFAEQARLLYVAMTRAKEELYLFSCRSRSGARTFTKASYQLKPSPMVGIVPVEHIEKRYRNRSAARKRRGTRG